jgi:hypothetical protein
MSTASSLSEVPLAVQTSIPVFGSRASTIIGSDVTHRATLGSTLFLFFDLLSLRPVEGGARVPFRILVLKYSKRKVLVFFSPWLID